MGAKNTGGWKEVVINGKVVKLTWHEWRLWEREKTKPVTLEEFLAWRRGQGR